MADRVPRPEEEIVAYLLDGDEQGLRLWARRVIAEIPNGTPDSELTDIQRKAWEILDDEYV